MNNRFPATDWTEFLVFLVVTFLIYLGMYGLMGIGFKIFEFIMWNLWWY